MMSGKRFKTVNFRNNPDLKNFVLKDAERTGRKLGVGSFGSVVEVTVGGTFFAGKRLHDNLLDTYDQGHTRLLDRFVSECKIMSDLRHPNIVQFMGLCFFDESIYPVLVMEQLDTSLDGLLEKRKKNFTLAPKLHILHNVAAGLLYLHDQCNPPIIHRDLTTRNVLINTASMQAKIADLGNALMIDTAKFSSTLSQMPGTLSYMPPEATVLKPKYDSSLDMFSFGHLSLYTIIQEFPADLLPATYEDPDTDELKARNEVTRRGHYFEMLYNKLSEEHVICKMIKACLSNKPAARPTASFVMDQLEDLIGDEDDPYEVFADICKLDLLELLNQKPDSSGVADIEASGEIQSRTEQIKNGAPGVLEVYRTSIGILKRSGWKMYFFQMTPSHLKYFKSSVKEGQKIIDEIKLSDVKTVKCVQNEDASKFYFQVAGPAVGKEWKLRAHTEEDRTCWMSAIKPSSTRRYTAGMGPRPRESESDCYDEIDAVRIPPSLQPNEAYNVLEESKRSKSPYSLLTQPPPKPFASPPKPSDHFPPPTETLPPPPPKSCPPSQQPRPPPIPNDHPQLLPSRPPPLPSCPPQNKQPPLPASPPPLPKSRPPSQQPRPPPIPNGHPQLPTNRPPPLPSRPPQNKQPPLPASPPPLPKSRPPSQQPRPPPIPNGHPQLPPNHPSPLPSCPPQNKQPQLPARNPPPPKKKQSAVSNTYIDVTKINPAALIPDDMLYEELPDDISAAIAASNVAPVPPPNNPSQTERMPQPYLIPSDNVSEDPELYEDFVRLQTEEPEETYEEMFSASTKPTATAEMPPIPDSPLKLQEMMKLDPNQLQMMMLIQMQMMMQKINPQSGSEGPPKSPLEKSTKPAPPKYPPGTYRPPVPLPIDENVHDEPQEIYDEDVSTKVNDELRKSLYVNIWDGEKPSPPPVPPKPKPKPALPPKPSKLQTAKGEPSSATVKLPKVHDGGQMRHVCKSQRGCDEASNAEDEIQKRSKYFFSRRRGNLEQNFTEMKMMLGNLLVQNEKLSSHCDNLLLDADDEEEAYIARPNWATASSQPKYNQGQLKEEDSLLALQKQALFIPRSSIQDLEPIGQGQFGKVYKANLHKGSGSSVAVAVKTIKKFKSQKETDDFLREMTVMSQMIHPNVVCLHGLVQQASPWMILELLPHSDLKSFLIKNERPVEKLIKYMLDVAVGMHYIAEKGLIHRDLAARNVMVGENEICKVADFGLLREIPEGKAIYVQSSQSLVPVRWLAPESIEKRQFSTASDVWSYGILLWEMFQPKKLPYEEYKDTTQCGIAVATGHRLTVPEPYPNTVERIMKNCWHKIPDKRPSFLLISSLLTNVTFGQN